MASVVCDGVRAYIVGCARRGMMKQVQAILWTRCRDVAAALIAALWPGRDLTEVLAWMDAGSPARQRAIVLGALAALFALSMIAAQFGLIGLCIFWMLIIWLIR